LIYTVKDGVNEKSIGTCNPACLIVSDASVVIEVLDQVHAKDSIPKNYVCNYACA